MKDQFNFFTALFFPLSNEYFADLDVTGRILHRSPCGKQLTIVARYPKGARGLYGAKIDYHETFYVIAGTGRRIMPDGEVVEMKRGDCIYVPPGIDVEWIYEPGFEDIAYFWSDKPLPDFLWGDIPYPAPES